jgi:hypothetical protein
MLLLQFVFQEADDCLQTRIDRMVMRTLRETTPETHKGARGLERLGADPSLEIGSDLLGTLE